MTRPLVLWRPAPSQAWKPLPRLPFPPAVATSFRNALCSSLQRPTRHPRLHPGRKNPGLSPQHLTGLRLVEVMCHGTLGGGRVRSSRICLDPGRLLCGRHLADTGTAGSCSLMLQQALPCMLFAAALPATGPSGEADPAAGAAAAAAVAAAVRPAAAAAAAAGLAGGGELGVSGAAAVGASGRWSELDLRGGTDAAFAPPVGYLEHVLAPALRRLLPGACGGLSVRVARRGFYPRGGGEVVARALALAPGEALAPLDVTRRGVVGGRFADEAGLRPPRAALGACFAQRCG